MTRLWNYELCQPLPIWYASSPEKRRPVQMSSLARETPINRESRCVPPAPGIISDMPKIADSEATRISQAKANSNPSPSATASTAEMTGRYRAATRCIVVRSRVTKDSA
mmetsp:Transcript_12839/g.25991  ORF Transcript_12839/g.25991 Transcript_12839/m.25991 type:complete len:109 (-) Transcript_12839:18-344(-)